MKPILKFTEIPPEAPHATTTAAMSWRDRLGIALSVLCLVHCLLTPFLVGLLPVGAALGFWQHGFHEVFLFVVPLVALIAFIPGWRQHGDSRVWYWGATGVVLLGLGVAVAEVFGHGETGAWAPLIGELVLTTAGGACLIRAHLLNRQLCACCHDGHDHSRGHDHDHVGHCAPSVKGSLKAPRHGRGHGHVR